MREWQGAVIVGQGPRWAILLTRTALGSGGRWVYTYSIAPGVPAYWVTGGGGDIVSPHDDIIISSLYGIAQRLPAART